MKRRAWTLVEILVVTTLLGLITLVATSLFLSTARVSRLHTQRAWMQGHLQTLMRELETTLQRAPANAITWQAGSPSVPAALVIHPLQEGVILSDRAQFSPFWRCYLWDRSNLCLYVRDVPPALPTLAAPSTSEAQPPNAAQMTQLTQQPAAGSRRLSTSVSHLTFAQISGPRVQLVLELQGSVPNPHKESFEKFRAERTFQLRNRS